MTEMLALLPADVWLLQMFSARAAREGGIVRRQVRDVERIVGRAAFEAELRKNAGQFVIFYNNQTVRVLC